MRSFRSWLTVSIIVGGLCAIACRAVLGQENLAQNQVPAAKFAPNLTEEQMKHFLLTGKVVKSRQTSKGVTNPWRLTLTDGNLTHDAAFQSIDESRNSAQVGITTELNFRDSYQFNIAAYELAKLIGLGNMMPVTVERSWQGKRGSMTWWLNVKMDDRERMEKKIAIPDAEAWNAQMHRMRVFKELVYDTDRNLTNVLIGENWELYMIDFSRAFRRHQNIENPKDLERCDRQLLAALRRLDPAEVKNTLKPHLTDAEIKAVMSRRDKIVAHFQQLITEKGEGAILY